MTNSESNVGIAGPLVGIVGIIAIGTPYMLVSRLNQNTRDLDEWLRLFPLTNTFCFKWYYIFVFTLIECSKPYCSKLITFLYNKMDKYSLLSNDVCYEEEFDTTISNLFSKNSDIPTDILFLIISYSHSAQNKAKIMRQRQFVQKEVRKNRNELIKFYTIQIYVLFSILLNILSFTILMLEYGQWFIKHSVELRNTNNIFWNGYAQFVILLIFHPSFKSVAIFKFYHERNERDLDDPQHKFRLYHIRFGVQIAIISCYFLSGCFIIFYCGFMFSIWVWIVIGLLIWIISWIIYNLMERNDIKFKKIIAIIIYGESNLFYMMINCCSWFTISYFINKNYLESLLFVATSKYCKQQIFIDFTNWKAVILFAHWFLF